MWKPTRSTSSRPIIFAIMMIFVAQLVVPAPSSEVTLVTPEEREASCPASCDLYFSKLNTSLSPEGTSSQSVELRERGEPKSGTGFAFEWGVQALFHTCKYLRQSFGEESCTIDVGMSRNGNLPELRLCSFTFEPGKGSEDARCSCPEVERVTILAQSGSKHGFPVERNCSWAHSDGLDIWRHKACEFPDGSRPNNYEEIWECMRQNPCQLKVGHEQQMVVFRDPREVVVSTYFFKAIYKKVDENGQPLETVDDFALGILPIICQWTAVRHILFGEYLADQSTIFWYDDIKADPIGYHRRWLASVGLQLPLGELKKAAEEAVRGEFDFWTKGVDARPHPESSSNSSQQSRATSLSDWLRNETLVEMDSILRQWLPPVFLSRLGVRPVA